MGDVPMMRPDIFHVSELSSAPPSAYLAPSSERIEIAKLALVCFDRGAHEVALALFKEAVSLRHRHWDFKWVQLFMFGLSNMTGSGRASMRVLCSRLLQVLITCLVSEEIGYGLSVPPPP